MECFKRRLAGRRITIYAHVVLVVVMLFSSSVTAQPPNGNGTLGDGLVEVEAEEVGRGDPLQQPIAPDDSAREAADETLRADQRMAKLFGLQSDELRFQHRVIDSGNRATSMLTQFQLKIKN